MTTNHTDQVIYTPITGATIVIKLSTSELSHITAIKENGLVHHRVLTIPDIWTDETLSADNPWIYSVLRFDSKDDLVWVVDALCSLAQTGRFLNMDLSAKELAARSPGVGYSDDNSIQAEESVADSKSEVMLKLTIVRLENSIVVQINHQDESLRRNKGSPFQEFKASNGFTIQSDTSPFMTRSPEGGALFLRGTARTDVSSLITMRFANPEQRDEYVESMTFALNQFSDHGYKYGVDLTKKDPKKPSPEYDITVITLTK